jgi:indole-3-glycerol phosphate synthase
MTIYLDQILDHKRHEVSAARIARPLETLLARIDEAPPIRPFRAALAGTRGRVGLIAEVKKASPSAGIIRPDFDYIRISKEYESAGADCLSILTDELFFQGHLAFIEEIKKAVHLPLLRKDFILDAYQVYEARAAGADAILLIVAALETAELTELYGLAKSLELDVLVETHTTAEMEVAASIGADLIGINSRDLKSFVTDLSVIEQVALKAPRTALLVAESGIKSGADVQRLLPSGINAILVGESLMRASSIATAVNNLLQSQIF